MKSLIWSSVVSLLFSLSVMGCSEDQSKNELIEDIDSYVKIIDEVHADPWRLISEESFREKAEELKQRIRGLQEDQISNFDEYFFLQELAAAIQDGHTKINLPDQYFIGKESIFPFTLKMIDGKCFVTEMWGEDKLPLYCEVLKINQNPIQDYRKNCDMLANTSLGHARDLMFEEAFPYMLETLFKEEPPWEVIYKLNGEEKTIEVNGMSMEEYMPIASERNTQYREYSFMVDDIEVPVLDIPSFSHGVKSDYNRFIDNFFEKHKESDYLVIDLRKNPGGDGMWGRYLLDCLTDEPYLVTKEFTFKVSQEMRRSGYTDKAGGLLAETENGEYLTVQKDRMRVPHENSGRFTDQVFCLISEKTFSAGVVTAAAFKSSKMGIIIGQETSGRIKLCSDPMNITLPNTRLAAKIPLAILELPGGDPNRGVVPDYQIQYKFDDYRTGRDLEIEKVKELISK